jgi:hypothetical protein
VCEYVLKNLVRGGRTLRTYWSFGPVGTLRADYSTIYCNAMAGHMKLTLARPRCQAAGNILVWCAGSSRIQFSRVSSSGDSAANKLFFKGVDPVVVL